MGMSTGGGKGSVQSDINVTPLIDVLLVLLIIFLVVMPIMMKMETLQVPRSINDQTEQPDPDSSMLTLKVAADMSISYTDGVNPNPRTLQRAEIQATLRPKLDSMAKEKKVVFVDFEDGVPWKDVVATMDEIRAMAADVNHDDIKVALKIRKPEPSGASQ
jgi:biopolymer transport protein ExbD